MRLRTWYDGGPNTPLTPLPAAPWPRSSSFHTVSLRIWPRVASSVVPPQDHTCGLDAGNSGCWPSICPSDEPASPAAALYVTPRSDPEANTASRPRMPCSDQRSSGAPQLIDTAAGRRVSSLAAAAAASMKPRSLFGAL